MNARLKELKFLGIMLGVFLAAYYIPFGAPRFLSGLHEAFFMLQDYARQHVLLCLIPALFIAGAVSVFISNVFYDNDHPIYHDAYYTMNVNNKFHNPANPWEGNKRNGIFLLNAGNPKGATVSWNVAEVPYVVDFNFTGGGDAAVQTVNIGQNVNVKFMGHSSGIASGASRQINFPSTAKFTSYKNDAIGGDTNGDGGESKPGKGDWKGFYDMAARDYLSQSNILYSAN